MPNLILYDHPLSGNCHKIRLFLSMLDVPHMTDRVDVFKRENTENWFVALNPLTQIPTIRDGDIVVQDSQAILTYLALKYAPEWFGRTPVGVAAVMEWLSFAAKEVCNGLQMSRLFYLAEEFRLAEEDIDIARATAQGLKVLSFLEDILVARDWLALARPTIADLAVFPYVAMAREGKLPLDDYPSVLAWIERISALPGYVPMRGLPGFVPSENDYKLER